MTEPQATVVITTKDRRDELRRALLSVETQTVDLETVVIDDGSTDGTSEMVSREFPAVRLHRYEVSEGPLPQRNRGTELASTPIVVSLDDDAEFMSPDTVAETLADFGHPRVAGVAIPYRNGSDGPVMQAAPSSDGVFVLHSFVAGVVAFRRDVFLAFGGYREEFGMSGEEIDLAIRMLDSGFVTRAGRAATPAVHERSRVRAGGRAYRGPRNDILTASLTVPALSLPVHLLRITAMALVGALGKPRLRLPNALRGLAHGYRDSFRLRKERQPVKRRTFKLRQRLWRAGGEPLDQLEAALPPLVSVPERRAEAVQLDASTR